MLLQSAYSSAWIKIRKRQVLYPCTLQEQPFRCVLRNSYSENMSKLNRNNLQQTHFIPNFNKRFQENITIANACLQILFYFSQQLLLLEQLRTTNPNFCKQFFDSYIPTRQFLYCYQCYAEILMITDSDNSCY